MPVSYRVIYDVSNRLPEIPLGAVALLVLAGVGLAAICRVDSVLVRWPLIISAGGGLFAAEGVVDQRPFVVVAGLLFIVVGVASELRSPRLPVDALKKTPVPGVTATMFGSFLLLFTGLSGLAMIPAIELSRQLNAGEAETIQGQVDIYFEVEGGKNECISVAERSFCYSDWVITPGFNRTRALGGPLRDGLQVRLSVIGDAIVRVEVAE